MSNTQGAFVNTEGRIWNDTAQGYEDMAWKASEPVVIGQEYTLNGTTNKGNQPLTAYCIGISGKIVTMISSNGFGIGTANTSALNPSSYNTNVGGFTITDVYFPTGTSANNLAANGITNQVSVINTALTKAASLNQVGATRPLGLVWSGQTDFMYGIKSGQWDYYAITNAVVAPSFKLNMDSVKTIKNSIIYAK